MAHDDERREHYQRVVREMQDEEFIKTFRMFDLSLAQMDRAELLGLICFMAKNPMHFRPVKEVKINEVK